MGALTSTGLGLHNLQQENNDGQQVGDIPQDAEDVHGAGGLLWGGGSGREVFLRRASAE